MTCLFFIVNRNTVPGDTSAFRPGGIRIGTPALTSRNFLENDMLIVSNFIDDCIQLTQKIEKSLHFEKQSLLREFRVEIEKKEWQEEINSIRLRVESFALLFPMPGFPAF